MEVFIGRLPPRTGEQELLKFLKGYYKRDGIRLRLVRQADGEENDYAVAEIDNDRLAAKAVKKLNGKELRGSQLEVREFIHRSYNNERRAIGWRNRPWSGPERRQRERRQQGLREPEVDPLFADEAAEKEEKSPSAAEKISISAYRNMARKF